MPKKVLSFTKNTLATALSSDITSEDLVKAKAHFLYLAHYLGAKGLKAKTIVIEEDYISKDYLHDYADYYSLCFEKYKKVCRRVHLFANKFSERQLDKILLLNEGEEKENFWENYLGHIVVKPIPVTVIGATLLRTYPHEGKFGGRTYWGLKDYTVNVFGVKRIIRSLVFQEQDKVTAACATTAIWSLLSKVTGEFQALYKSPSRITKDAERISQDGNRLFPTKGLSVLQITQAIERSGLVCEVKHSESGGKNDVFTKNIYLKELVRAYSAVGIPIIVVIRVTPTQYHAITLVGHRHQGPSKVLANSNSINFMAQNIDRLYAHDDQFGPFARIKFDGDDRLITPWNEFKGNNSLNQPTDVIISTYPKIRIDYQDIKLLVLALHGLFNEMMAKKPNAGWEWDIRLEYSEHFKSEVRSIIPSKTDAIQFLTSPMPRFIWVVTCWGAQERLMDFIFDATGVITGMIGLKAIIYEKELKPRLHTFLKRVPFSDYYEDHPIAPMYGKWLLKETEK